MTQGWVEEDYFSIFPRNKKGIVRKLVMLLYYEPQPLFAYTTNHFQPALLVALSLNMSCDFR